MRNSIYVATLLLVASLCTGCLSMEAIQEFNRLGLGLACDYDTDGGGLEANYMFVNILEGVAVGPTLEVLRGKETHDYSKLDFKTGGGITSETKYNVVRGAVRATYPVAVSDNRPISVYPMIRPGVYYWSARDFDSTETLFTVDFGGGIAYGPVELDLFSTIDGPNFSTRLRFNIPL